ncbi:MAG: exosortase/archaeosortase family protein [Tepidisphaeraceae bacterium]
MSQTQLSEESYLGAMVAGATGDAPDAAADPIVMGLKRSVWIQIGVISALFGGLFWPNLRRLWDKTNPFYGEANWGHAICIPVIGLYYLYVNRERLLSESVPGMATRNRKARRVWGLMAIALVLPLVLVREEASRELIPVVAIVTVLLAATAGASAWRGADELIDRADQHSAGWFGISIMLFGIAVFQYAIFPGQNDFLKDFGMVITLFGVVLGLAGWHVMRLAWFPIAFLVCGLPWPGLVYSKVAGPLQQLAANVAVWTLQLTGVEASVGGTKISMIGGDGNWRTLNVAEACAGMRSLMTFISVAAAVAFLSHRPLWQKLIVVLFAVPIAIFCNVMRVSGQGLLDRYVSHALSENFAHQFVGLIMLIPAFLLILLVGWVLDQIFVEQIDRRVVAMAPKVITRSTAAALSAAKLPKTAPRSLAAVRAAATPETDAPPKRPQVKPPPPAKPVVTPVKPMASVPRPTGLPRRPINDRGIKTFRPPPQAPRPLSSPKRGSGNGDSNTPRESP